MMQQCGLWFLNDKNTERCTRGPTQSSRQGRLIAELYGNKRSVLQNRNLCHHHGLRVISQAALDLIRMKLQS